MLLVLDASFIAKWFKEENHTEIALKIKEEFVRGEHDIVVPDLLLYELTNAIRYDKSFDSDLVKQAIASLIDLGIDIVIPTADLIAASVGLARKFEISIYDAVYIALSDKLDAVFVTADKKLYEKIRSLDFAKFIANLQANE